MRWLYHKFMLWVISWLAKRERNKYRKELSRKANILTRDAFEQESYLEASLAYYDLFFAFVNNAADRFAISNPTLWSNIKYRLSKEQIGELDRLSLYEFKHADDEMKSKMVTQFVDAKVAEWFKTRE